VGGWRCRGTRCVAHTHILLSHRDLVKGGLVHIADKTHTLLSAGDNNSRAENYGGQKNHCDTSALEIVCVVYYVCAKGASVKDYYCMLVPRRCRCAAGGGGRMP
jgi:hypothetical protein